jgi:hypothetical protein
MFEAEESHPRDWIRLQRNKSDWFKDKYSNKETFLCLALLPNGAYWLSYTDVLNEGRFVEDPELPNDRDIHGALSW